MNWDAVGALAELVGAVGVVASLVFVGLQVRQNTRSMRASTYDSLVRSNGDWISALIQDPSLASAFETAVTRWSDVDVKDRPRVMYLLTQLFRHWENSFFQRRQGTLEPSLWATWEGIILSYFHQPGIQEWWKVRRHAYSAEFRAFLEASPPPDSTIRTTRQLGELSGEVV
jgi:hypothetical protein